MDLLGRYSNAVEIHDQLRSLAQATAPHTRSPSSDDKSPRIHALERRLRREDFDQILVDYLAGKTSRQLGRQYGLSKSSVLRILHRYGVVRRRGDTTSVFDV